MAQDTAVDGTQDIDGAAVQTAPEAEQDALVEDVLVEEVSIDGMCGVY